jgi:hypothetical protein
VCVRLLSVPSYRHVRISRSARSGAALVAFVVVVLSGSPVAAHGGEGPGLEVVPNRVEPGETVTILGEELEPLASVQVALLTASGDQLVIATQVDDEGHFVESVMVPVELTPRVYELRATDRAGVAVSTYLTVLPAGQERAEAAARPMEPVSLALAGVMASALLLLIVRRLRASG